MGCIILTPVRNMNWLFKFFWQAMCAGCLIAAYKTTIPPALVFYFLCAILSGLCSMISYGMQADTK